MHSMTCKKRILGCFLAGCLLLVMRYIISYAYYHSLNFCVRNRLISSLGWLSNEAIDFTIGSVLQSLLPVGINGNCDNIMETKYMQSHNYSHTYITEHDKFLHKIAQLPKTSTEFGSDSFPAQSKFLHMVAQLPQTKVVCETGFNIGHSSLTFLSAQDDIVVHSFDIGTHPGAKPMAEYLGHVFGDRFHIHFGDSTVTLPQFHQDNPNIKCDVIFVDGGHQGKVPWLDILNFIAMAIPGRTILVFDDYPAYWGMPMVFVDIAGAWELAIHKGLLQEVMRCSSEPISKNHPERGFCVGIVMFNEIK